MSKKQSSSQEQIGLPNLDLVECSEQTLAAAFLSSAQVLNRHLERMRAVLAADEEFRQEPFNLLILGLFSKMCKHYYSYTLLEVHQDRTGSRLLLEHLVEAAVTLTYLVEEGDESSFSEYAASSVQQACSLCAETEEQLQQFVNHPDLLILRDQLKTVIVEQQAVDGSVSTNSEVALWGSQSTDTTTKRANIIGLNFLSNPARQLAVKVTPASWLDIQLNYNNFLTRSSRTKAEPGINFTNLGDAAFLCLHATQALLEEVVSYQGVKLFNIKYQQQLLNVLYEWFYNAQRVCQRRTSHERREYDVD